LRQSIALPEMLIWWAAFPLLVLGWWFAMKHRLRQVAPIVLFTTMLTLAYAVFQGNVGTAYRQRSQLLVFYFIFVAVGAVIMLEKREDRVRQAKIAKQDLADLQAARILARRNKGKTQGSHSAESNPI
jgi:putative Ca2+/H+ antiporter (TMEM165/GDT1 family)